jgi:4-methylaminobutanoate oxidase (formaldehyde-forming)
MVRAADAVIVGGGVLGACLAYYLARRGMRHLVLLEQYEVGSQTSSRAAGLTDKTGSDELSMRLADEAVEALAAFQEETGQSIGFERVGALWVALTPEGERHLRALCRRMLDFGIAAEMLSHAEAHRLAPWLHPGRARAVMHSPEDGYVNPSAVTPAFLARAVALGVRVGTRSRVEAISGEEQVRGVRTQCGEIEAPIVVIAAGAWSAQLGSLVQTRVPAVPTRHQLALTEPLAITHEAQPSVRLLESSIYLRAERGGLLIGGHEPRPHQLRPPEPSPAFRVDELVPDHKLSGQFGAEIEEFIPVLKQARVREQRVGLPTFTPDGRSIVGPVPGIEGLYVLTGCNAAGLFVAPALGRALADLIVDRRVTPDLSPLYLERFADRFTEEPVMLEAARRQYARRYLDR